MSKRIRELDEKYVSALPYSEGRRDIAWKMQYLLVRYKESDSFPEYFETQVTGFLILCAKRWCSSHLTLDEYVTIVDFANTLDSNARLKIKPSKYIKHEDWVEEIKWLD